MPGTPGVAARNARIVRRFLEGATVDKLAADFGIGELAVRIVLQDAGEAARQRAVGRAHEASPWASPGAAGPQPRDHQGERDQAGRDFDLQRGGQGRDEAVDEGG